MSFHSWLPYVNQLLGRTHAAGNRRRRPAASTNRLRVECLDDRIVPATNLPISPKLNALINPGVQIGNEGAAVQLQLKPGSQIAPVPLTYNATGLPKGLTIDQQTGIISGTFDNQAGRKAGYTIKISASDGVNTSKPQSFRWLVKDITKPTVYVPDQTYRVGQGVALDLHAFAQDASGDSLSFKLSGKLPKGLRFDAGTGSIYGVLSAPGEHQLRLNVTDGVHVSTARFSWTVNPPLESDLAAPRVVGAVSLSNKTVLVAFNKPMSLASFAPGNFSITQTNPNGVAGLTVVSARMASPTQTIAELTTLSQSELNYTVAVTNVFDLSGQALSAPIVQSGILVDPSRASFTGKAPSLADLVDTDHDGLYDNEEQRGWLITTRVLNGTSSQRWVTSDPMVADSDADGLLDYDEYKLGLDPRNTDTDRDQLADYSEYNEIYSDPTNVDSDGDGLDDSLEFGFYHSSPTDKDTDGDQIADNLEAVLGNRNMRLADVPKPGIEIGSVLLRLDVHQTFTNQAGETTTESQSAESTLTQTDSKSSSNTDANSHEFTVKAGYETGWSTSVGADGVEASASGKFSVEGGTTNSWSSSFTEESAKQTQKAVAKTFGTERQATQEETVQREIAGATMKVSLNLKSLSNIAFTIKNLQITAFVQDPSQFGKLIPIATLLPDSEPDEGFTLGPQVPERGPFIFSNDSIFASLVQELMLNPQGLVFKISNYDIVDERGRNFAFSSQEINDRTAPLVIDFGFGDINAPGVGGTTERYRVSTSAGRKAVDTNGDGQVDDNDRTVIFEPSTGRAVGITISDVMENVLGLTRYDEDTTPSSTLSQLELATSYSTRVLLLDTDGEPGTPSVPVETLWRVRDVSSDLTNPLKRWFIYTSKGIDTTTNFRDLVLKPENGLTFKFLQDLDDDGIDAAQEFILGSSDSNKLISVSTPDNPTLHQQMKGLDSDLDGLTDAFEFFGGPTPASLNTGWNVEVVGKTAYRAFSSPARQDSDLDGISDYDEYNRFVDLDTDGDGTPDLLHVRKSTDPQNPDTDGDGISDANEIRGYDIKLRFPAGTVINKKSDPLNPDTDGDTLQDGDEQTLGTDPTADDADKVLDDDGDRLVNFLEDASDPTSGWTVTVHGVSTTSLPLGAVDSYHVVSNSQKKDTDNDGLTDKEEFDLKTDPTKADTDGDGLNDVDEVNITDNGPGQPRTITLKYHPLDADMDNDRRTDGAEVNTPLTISIVGETPYDVFSDPKIADVDHDLLVDGEEEAVGTDPTLSDTDGDNPGISDKKEIAIGTNPLKPDQKIKITIVSVGISGSVSDQSGGLDLWGKIQIGKGGTFVDVKSYTEQEEADTGYNTTLNQPYEFLLSAGEKVTLKTVNFFDNDDTGTDDGIPDAGDDLFTDASKEFEFTVNAQEGVLESLGDAETGNVKLQVFYKIEIVGL